MTNSVRRPNKVQFDLSVNKTQTTTLPPTSKHMATMPPLDSTISTNRAASNNSCTGGSNDANKNNSTYVNKSTNNTTQ